MPPAQCGLSSTLQQPAHFEQTAKSSPPKPKALAPPWFCPAGKLAPNALADEGSIPELLFSICVLVCSNYRLTCTPTKTCDAKQVASLQSSWFVQAVIITGLTLDGAMFINFIIGLTSVHA